MKTTLCTLGAVAVAGLIWACFREQSATLPQRTGTPKGGKIVKSDEEWRKQLTPEQYRVTRHKATECRFTGIYWNNHQDGIYECVCCGQPLFDAKAKFESGTGWPSFWQPVAETNVSLMNDWSGLTMRTEVLCSRCDAHLGHVFSDGPAPSGLRYCLNSAALRLVERAAVPTSGEIGPTTKND